MNSTSSRRVPRLAREARIDRILHLARDVFCERGYEDAAVADIAARLGIVEGTIYKYFESKRELLLRVLQHWYDEMFGDYTRDLEGISGARQRVRYLLWRHLRTMKEHPALCRLMFSEVRSRPDYFNSELHCMNRRYTKLLMGVVQEGSRTGEFRRGLSLPLIRDLLFGCMEHHAWNYLYGHGQLEPEQVSEQLSGILCEGIDARDPAANAISRQADRLAVLADRLEGAVDRNGKKRGTP